MKRPELPELAKTGRRYVENTGRARLAGAGIERFASRRPRSAATSVALAVVLFAALVGAMLLLSR